MPILSEKRFISSFILFFSILFGFFSIVFLGVTLQKTSAAETNPATAYVSRSGTKLYLNVSVYQFTGVNAYNLGTYPGANAGCGGYVKDIDAFFSTLRPNSMVRLWAFQGSMVTNVTTKKIDWTGLDRVVNAAQKNGKKLILVLAEQAGHCDDGHWKDLAWYNGGYKMAYNDLGNGLTPLPYLEYIKLIVTRYKDSPAVAMWEPINEPVAANCPVKGYQCYSQLVCGDETANAKALRSFFDTIGATIKSIDTKHLISSGTNGDGQCGTIFENYKYVHESPGIDVGSFHDYYRDNEPLPGDQWNGLQKRIQQLNLLNKPLIIGEVGMLASSTGTGCMTMSTRRDKIKAKMDAQFKAGIAGFLPWSLTLGGTTNCNYDIGSGDPLIALLRDYPVLMSSVVPSVVVTPFPTPTPIPADTTPPTAPTLSASNVTTSQVTLSWSGATDNKAVERYDIFKDWYYVTSTTGTSYTVSGLTAGMKYMFFVKAKDTSANYSKESNQVTITTLSNGTPLPEGDIIPPTAPTNLTAKSLTTSQIALQWSPSTDNEKVDRYEVYKDYQYVTAVWGTSYTVNNLTAGKTYTFYLKARDTAGNSSTESVIVKGTTQYSGPTPTPTKIPTPTPTKAPDTTPPTAPTNLTTLPGQTQVTLNWTAATDNVGVDRYEVYRDWQYVTAVWGTSYTNTGLTPGKTYLYYLKSRDRAGNSSGESMKVTVTTLP